MVIPADMETNPAFSVNFKPAIDADAFAADLLVNARHVPAYLRGDNQAAISVNAAGSDAVKFQHDRARVRSGVEDEIVFQRSAGAVIDQVDARVDAADLQCAEIFDVGSPGA